MSSGEGSGRGEALAAPKRAGRVSHDTSIPLLKADRSRSREGGSMNVLVVDVGGTHVKILATGQTEKREFDSGPDLTAQTMVAGVRKLAADWTYGVVSIGYPGPVLRNRPVADPHNLGPGWMGFD